MTRTVTGGLAAHQDQGSADAQGAEGRRTMKWYDPLKPLTRDDLVDGLALIVFILAILMFGSL